MKQLPELRFSPSAMLDAQMLTWSKAYPAAHSFTSAFFQQQETPAKPSSADMQPDTPPRHAHRAPSAAGAASTEASRPAVSSSLDTGMLDMSAFGMDFTSSEAKQKPQAAQQKPSAIDTGMIDMSAFGMSYEPPEAADDSSAGQQQSSQQQGIESGMLDMSAFGMSFAPEPEPEKATSQQQKQSAIDTGMLDMSAFGMSYDAADEESELDNQQQLTGRAGSTSSHQSPKTANSTAEAGGRWQAPASQVHITHMRLYLWQRCPGVEQIVLFSLILTSSQISCPRLTSLALMSGHCMTFSIIC